jgi:hypothetical protein
MKWTSEEPGVEGWYLWRRSGKVGDPFHWISYYYEKNTDQLWSEGKRLEIHNRISKGGQWAGPIPEPEE